MRFLGKVVTFHFFQVIPRRSQILQSKKLSYRRSFEVLSLRSPKLQLCLRAFSVASESFIFIDTKTFYRRLKGKIALLECQLPVKTYIV